MNIYKEWTKDCETAFANNILYLHIGYLSKVETFHWKVEKPIAKMSLERSKCIVTPL